MRGKTLIVNTADPVNKRQPMQNRADLDMKRAVPADDVLLFFTIQHAFRVVIAY